jgi:4-hydroxybenzoate polyprenyltransferase
MDLPTDTEQGIASLPARFGASSGRWLPIALHGVTIASLTAAGLIAHAGGLYYLGVLAGVVLVFYENHLCDRIGNIFILNERIFTSNMVFSVAFLITTIAGFRLHR